ncbi:MAG TPA: transglycosylase SLT domain-containing protein [Pseudonocardia sp.]|nr:transglycosylase SLT domain-containing protein [Pseudonocardia sp.]
MSDLLDAAVRRWAEAAALLAGAGRTPAAVLSWLGPAWSGPAARAYDEWAGLFEQATLRTSGALRDSADSIRLHAEQWPRVRLEIDFGCVDSGSRAITAVPLPGSRAGPGGVVGSHDGAGSEPDRGRSPTEAGSPSDDGKADGKSEPEPEVRREDERVTGPPPAPVPDQPPASDPGAPAQGGNNVDGWIQQAVAILREHGYRPEQIDPEAIETIIRHESSGDPAAVNNWDSNAARGTPSMGLMQTIEPTFDRWHVPGHGEILDPVDNIVAGVRYAVDRYGSVSLVPGVLSLAAGRAYRGY